MIAGEETVMTKRQLIDEITTMNQSAKPSFLAKFEDTELDEYLQHLRLAQTPRLVGDPHRFDHYFDACPTVAVAERIEGSESKPTGEIPEATAIEQMQVDAEAPAVTLDLHVSPNAYFKDSYEAKAS